MPRKPPGGILPTGNLIGQSLQVAGRIAGRGSKLPQICGERPAKSRFELGLSFKDIGMQHRFGYYFPTRFFYCAGHSAPTEVPVGVWRSYLRFHLLDSRAPFLDKQMQGMPPSIFMVNCSRACPRSRTAGSRWPVRWTTYWAMHWGFVISTTIFLQRQKRGWIVSWLKSG